MILGKQVDERENVETVLVCGELGQWQLVPSDPCSVFEKFSEITF